MSLTTLSLYWAIAAIFATVGIKKFGPDIKNQNLAERIRDMGYVSVFGYLFVISFVVLTADYYLGYWLGEDMPAWLQSISYFGPQKLPFYGWLINGIAIFGFAGWVFRLAVSAGQINLRQHTANRAVAGIFAAFRHFLRIFQIGVFSPCRLNGFFKRAGQTWQFDRIFQSGRFNAHQLAIHRFCPTQGGLRAKLGGSCAGHGSA